MTQLIANLPPKLFEIQLLQLVKKENKKETYDNLNKHIYFKNFIYVNEDNIEVINKYKNDIQLIMSEDIDVDATIAKYNSKHKKSEQINPDDVLSFISVGVMNKVYSEEEIDIEVFNEILLEISDDLNNDDIKNLLQEYDVDNIDSFEEANNDYIFILKRNKSIYIKEEDLINYIKMGLEVELIDNQVDNGSSYNLITELQNKDFILNQKEFNEIKKMFEPDDTIQNWEILDDKFVCVFMENLNFNVDMNDVLESFF